MSQEELQPLTNAQILAEKAKFFPEYKDNLLGRTLTRTAAAIIAIALVGTTVF